MPEEALHGLAFATRGGKVDTGPRARHMLAHTSSINVHSALGGRESHTSATLAVVDS